MVLGRSITPRDTHIIYLDVKLKILIIFLLIFLLIFFRNLIERKINYLILEWIKEYDSPDRDKIIELFE
jgi:hypothetical protein